MKNLVELLIIAILFFFPATKVSAFANGDSIIKVTYKRIYNNPPFPESVNVEYLIIDGNKSFFFFGEGKKGKDGKISARVTQLKDWSNQCLYFIGSMYPEYSLDSYWSDSLPAMKWTILNQFITINNNYCQKAVTTFRGRDYTAFYALNIPIQDGPLKFCGLPGLIVKISDSKEIFNYEMSNFEKIPNVYNLGIGKVYGDYNQFKRLFKKWHLRRLEKDKARREADPNCLDCGEGVTVGYTFIENLLD
ncbi:MAG: GLPGLI family protein [Chitinophagaceae bacterium]|nr:GLPGLI family protein [Bacteroidota bacterium]MCC6257999.1 GLPGLI family protein [Chitinophagaceae bacterium]MCW5917629.1 GLPGLI family protein [Ferruginibacter sp.]